MLPLMWAFSAGNTKKSNRNKVWKGQARATKESEGNEKARKSNKCDSRERDTKNKRLRGIEGGGGGGGGAPIPAKGGDEFPRRMFALGRMTSEVGERPSGGGALAPLGRAVRGI